MPPRSSLLSGAEARSPALREEGGKVVLKPQIQQEPDSPHIHTHSHVLAFGISAKIRE